MSAPTRTVVLWFPDWPVTAWERAGNGRSGPVAVLRSGRVIACSAEARADGVLVGMRKREAQSRCPALTVVATDPLRDAREFAPVVARIEQTAPGVQVLSPGVCALRSRGPARYFGGEERAAQALVNAVAEIGVGGAGAGVADGRFTAQLAARLAAGRSASQGGRVRIVPEGAAADFLAPLPITALEDEELIKLLPRLGVRTLGQFAALEARLVRERFGDRGIHLHALAAGADSSPVVPRVPPPELMREIGFEPPLTLAEQVAFSIRQTVDDFIAGLARQRLVCTELRVALLDEDGRASERVWLHPASFDAVAVVDRVRWQLDAASGTLGAVVTVRLEPIAVDTAAHHAPSLFGSGLDERVHHTLSRVQAMLGPEEVVVPVIGGGRWLAERQHLVPWGHRDTGIAPRQQPWPGSLPSPLPATVFPSRHQVQVLDAEGEPVLPDERGGLRSAPAMLIERTRLSVTGWAGPWPITERGWDQERARDAYRIQVVATDDTAWLLVCEGGQWWAEGRYD